MTGYFEPKTPSFGIETNLLGVLPSLLSGCDGLVATNRRGLGVVKYSPAIPVKKSPVMDKMSTLQPRDIPK